MGEWLVRKVVFGLLVAACAAGAMSDVAQAGGRGCRPVSASDPMRTSQTFGIATCGARGPRYHTNDFVGEAARGYAHRRSSDPMVWSDAQWRSSLFDGYSDTYNDTYDRRFRRTGHDRHVIVQRIEQRIVIREAPTKIVATAPAKRTRAKVLNMYTRQKVQPLENSSHFAGHRCDGILVLTWKAGGARSQCHQSGGRIRRY
jgi:hypothetical protein